MTDRPGGPPAGRVQAATLLCEVCGLATPHRILRSTVSRDGSIQGIARCRQCRSTHPFNAPAARTSDLQVIVSDGRTSTPQRRTLPVDTVLTRGELYPGAPSPWRVQRLDGTNGRSPRQASAGRVATVWVVLDRGAEIPVSLVEGRRTRPLLLQAPPTQVLGIGDPVIVDGLSVTIVAMRAGGRTWRQFGDRFPAAEIARLYTRRTVSPPAGRSAWSRDRGRSSSRASDISASARSRSSPGVSSR